MSKARLSIFASAVLLVAPLSLPRTAAALSIDFDDRVHGEVIGSQYAGSHGVVISVDNFQRSWDLGVAFDTGRTGTSDQDLEGPFALGNLAGIDLGKVLIINQNATGCDDGVCDDPDDEGKRAAGSISFEFDTPLLSLGFDLIDVDDLTLEAGSIDFFFDQTPVASVGFAELFCASSAPLCDATLATGNGSANRIAPIAAEFLGGSFNRVAITLGGSGAVDNLEFQTVPEPSTALLGGAALCALFGLRRRLRHSD